jgi:hypothetical protein
MPVLQMISRIGSLWILRSATCLFSDEALFIKWEYKRPEEQVLVFRKFPYRSGLSLLNLMSKSGVPVQREHEKS